MRFEATAEELGLNSVGVEKAVVEPARHIGELRRIAVKALPPSAAVAAPAVGMCPADTAQHPRMVSHHRGGFSNRRELQGDDVKARTHARGEIRCRVTHEPTARQNKFPREPVCEPLLVFATHGGKSVSTVEDVR